MRCSVLATLLLTSAPALAAPRFTARLQHATATEAVRRLETFYGHPVRLAPDPERQKDAAGPPRASFDWRDASQGQVVRDVERAFQLQAVHAADGSLRFSPAIAEPPTLTTEVDKITVTLGEVRQTETRRKLVGAGTTEVERTLRLTLVIRAKEGEAEVIRGVASVTVADERGNRSETTGVAVPLPVERIPAHADERVIQMELPAPRASASGSMRVEGQVLLSPSARTYRVEFSGPEHTADRGDAGPVRIAALPADAAPTSAATLFALSWPASVRIDAGTGIRCFLRKADGSVASVALSGLQSFLAPDGGGSARTTMALPSGAAGIVVWDITVLDPQERPVSFRFPHVLLPLAAAPRPASPIRQK